MKKILKIVLIIITFILLITFGYEGFTNYKIQNTLNNHYKKVVKIEDCKSLMSEDFQKTCLINVDNNYRIVKVSKEKVLLDSEITKDDYFNSLENK